MEAQRPKQALDGLLYPIVILDRHGNICFMNGAARRLLPEGLDLRLAAYVRGKRAIGPVSQVHFKLPNGRDLVLKVRLGEIEWLGEKATQVSLSNVTPYLAMIQELQKELLTQKQAGGRTRRSPRGAGQAPGGICGRVRRPRPGAGRRPRPAREPGPRHAEKPGCNRTSPGPRTSTSNRKRLWPRNWSGRARNLSWKRARRPKRAGSGKPSAPGSCRAPPRWPRRSNRPGNSPIAGLAAQKSRGRSREGPRRRGGIRAERVGVAPEMEALRRDLEQRAARAEEQSSQVSALREENKRLAQDLADRSARESELAAARDALEVKAEAIARQLAAAWQEIQRGVSEGHVRELERQRACKALAAQVEKLQSELSAATVERDGLTSRASALVASLEQAGRHAEAEASQRGSAGRSRESPRCRVRIRAGPFQVTPGIRGAPARVAAVERLRGGEILAVRCAP